MLVITDIHGTILVRTPPNVTGFEIHRNGLIATRLFVLNRSLLSGIVFMSGDTVELFQNNTSTVAWELRGYLTDVNGS